MNRPLLAIYALAVCFVAAACLAVASGYAIYDLVQIASPEITLSSGEYERHQSNAAFRNAYYSDAKIKAMAALSEEEVTTRRREEYISALGAERRTGWQSLLRMAIIILVSVVFFVIHWKLAQRVREP